MDPVSDFASDRRMLLGAGALAATLASSAAMAATVADPALEAAFRAAFAAPADAPARLFDARLAFLADTGLYIDQDVLFLIDRAAAADHLGFQARSWERLEVVLTGVKTLVQGGTGIASAYFSLRGKPRDSGFRLRPGFVTAVCLRSQAGWRALSLHLAPLSAQILDASPA